MLISDIFKKVIDGVQISREEALFILRYQDVEELLDLSWEITRRFRGGIGGFKVNMCGIVNARSALCPEDCAFCAQSIKFNTGVKRYPLISIDEVLNKARETQKMGASRFGIVTAERGPSDSEVQKICRMVSKIKTETSLEPDASLGKLTEKQAKALADAGVFCYNHNIETSAKFFPKICTTHTFEDRLRTIKIVKEYFKLCSGCIFGMGETDEDRVDIAFTLKDIDPYVIPINFLDPRPGTPLAHFKLMDVGEALCCIAMMRFVHPSREIKVAGGRVAVFGDNQVSIFKAGADSIIIGDYLTTKGRPFLDDLEIIKSLNV